MNVYIKNDYKDRILHDRHEHTDHFTYLETMGETHETLHEQRKTELFANENLTVHGSSNLAIDDKWLLKVGDEVHIKAGIKVVLEAGSEFTIKGGGNFIKIDSSGIQINGTKVDVNSGGSPGVGSGSNALLPTLSQLAPKSTPPKKIVSSCVSDGLNSSSGSGAMFVETF